MYLCWHVASYGVNDTQLEQNQGSKLRLTGRQCDQKLSTGD